jgi:glycosyltransferase involved in cell wall biosynthesis
VIHILTGEYPPTIGGVSDYSALLAAQLAARGEHVHVWVPEGGQSISARGVEVHHTTSLAQLDRSLNRMPRPRRLIVQWTPHSFGRRSLNVPLTCWLWKRAHFNHDRVEVMVHEAFLAFGEGSWRRNAAAAVHRLMAVLLMDAASKVWISIPAWEKHLRPWCFRGRKPFEWLPVPGNVVPGDRQPEADEMRARFAPSGQPLVGHFGTFRPDIELLLTPAILALLEAGHVTVLLAGRGSDNYHAWFTSRHPDLEHRVITSGELPSTELAHVLSACDVMLQPYPDGISTRRGTAMAALALGVPVVTNLGRLSEPLWESSGAVAIASSASPTDLSAEILQILDDCERRSVLAASARELYRVRFDIRHTVAALLREPPSPPHLARVIA